jgi:hypothetical protein
LRPDDVHDALLGVTHRMQPDAELFAIASQRLDLGARDRVSDRLVDVDRRHVVVFGGDGEVGPAHRAPVEPKPIEGLRAGHLMYEVQIDVDQVWLARFAFACAVGDDVVSPHLLCHGARRVDGGHT